MSSVSVIVPNYNHARYLKQRIDSILDQTYQDFDLILLDDASSDDSREVLESYRDNAHVTHIVYNEKNGGTPFKQWDKGIELASGEWIWIAESDDFADERFLESLMGIVKDYPDVGFAFSSTYFVNGEGKIIGRNGGNDHGGKEYAIHKSKLFIKDRLSIRNTVDNVSECIFRKSLYHPEDKRLYEHMKLCGDWLFYVLLVEQTDVLELYTPLSYYRKHSYNTVLSTEHDGRTFTEGVSIYKYISRNVCKFKQHDYLVIARYWLQNKQLYGFSADTNKGIKRLYLKELPQVLANYYVLSFKRSFKRIVNR